MKKILALILCTVMLLSLAACNPNTNTTDSTPAGNGTPGNTTTGSNEQPPADEKVDFSKFDADFSKWTDEDMVAYLVAYGLYPSSDAVYISTQVDYPGAGFTSFGTYFNDEETINDIIIYWADPTNEDAATDISGVLSNGTVTIPGEMPFDCPIDKLIGKFAFCYLMTTVDQDHNALMDAALAELCAHFNIAPDFEAE